MKMKTITTECPYCHKPDIMAIEDRLDLPEPFMRACPGCWKRKMNVKDIEHTLNPTCPHCGWEEHSGSYFYRKNDGDTSDLKCEICDSTFTTTFTEHESFSNEIKN